MNGQRPFERPSHRDFPGKGPHQSRDYSLDKKKIEQWILKGIDKETVEFANGFGEFIANNGLTTSQIRTTFGEMRRIQLNDYVKEKTAFILLKPKLAYAVKRHGKTGLEKFYELFSIAYDFVDTENDNAGSIHFKNLMNLMEAVLAYHKFHGGKE